MMKSEYKRMNERIIPEERLKEEVMEKVEPQQVRRFRPGVVIAAALVLILAATPVMAECMPWILEQIAPELVEELAPVQRSDTDNGITLEVVAASLRGNAAELVVRVAGEVLAEPVGVAPFLKTNTGGHTSTTIHSILDYEGVEDDTAKGIYYYRVTMQYLEGTPIEEILNGEMTVTLSDILISGPVSEEVEIPVILTDDTQITMTHVADLERYGYSCFGWGDSEAYEYGCELGNYVMMPAGEVLYDVTDKLALSGAAYIDGKLHVQMAAVDMNGGEAEWGYAGPYLVDAQGNRAEYLYRNLFGMDEGATRIDYEERIYDIPQEELGNYTMLVDLEYYNMIPVNCEVTFRFSEDEVAAE